MAAPYPPAQPTMMKGGVTYTAMYPPAAVYPPPPLYPHAFQNGGYAGNVGARDRSRTPHGKGAAPGRYTGVVKSFRGSFGFITSAEHAGDIYVSAKDNPDEVLQPGDTVEFELVNRPGLGNNGSAAINVWKVGGGNVPPPPMGAPPFAYAAQASRAPPPRVPSNGKGGGPQYGGAGQTLVGTMASVKDGWGFIQSPSVAGDIFIGLRDNPGLSGTLPGVGEEVSFEIALDPKTGRHKALNAAPSMGGTRVRGTVKEVREGGWGFASADGVDGQVMLGQRNLAAAGIQQLSAGDVLDFDLQRGKRGYEAVNITWPE